MIDLKDQLFLEMRAGAGVSAPALDRALSGEFSEDPRDALLVAYWLAGEITAAARENWWNSRKGGSLLHAIGLATPRYTAGWGGRSEYPLTTWSFDYLHDRWPLVYEHVLDEYVVPLLKTAPSALNAVDIAKRAHSEACLRAVALTASALPSGLYDSGATTPMRFLLGEHYDNFRPRRIERLFSTLDWYALLWVYREWGGTVNVSELALALARARSERRDPYLAVCERIHARRWYVQAVETGARTYSVSAHEQGSAEIVRSGNFDTEEESLGLAVAWTDALREHCREHNYALAFHRREELLSALEGFAGAQQRPHQESASALAARKAAVALDASEVVQMLRARL